jgi:hypothetical protein
MKLNSIGFHKKQKLASPSTQVDYSGRKSSEKIRKFSAWNTASTKSSVLAGIGRFRTGLFDLGMTANICQVPKNSG